MALIQSLLDRLRPQGVTRVVYGSDAFASIEGKTPAELYAEQPHLRTVTDFLGQNVAQLPLKCYMRRGDTDRVRDTDGPLPLLLADPNPDMTAYDLMYSTVLDWCLYGRVIWLVGRDSASPSGWQIRPIPAPWVTQWREGDGFGFRELSFRDTAVGGGEVTVPTSQCVIFTSYKPGDPARALSPIESLKHTLGEQMEAQAFRRSVWANATRITGYIHRPQGVEWTQGAADRFKRDMRENWGRGGSHAGGTPVLEDGMEYRPVSFDAKERDWASGVKLSREDVAAAYHVNPSIIWPAEGQTYASAKDNARALYADTLAPLLTMLQRRINKSLLPMIGADPSEYVEFDINAKLQGSFEEQAAALQSAVGGPWMTREEARALRNLPRVPDGELITPLNVLVGGLASPNDTAPKSGAVEGGARPHDGGPCGCKSCSTLKASPAPHGVRYKASPAQEEEGAYADVLRAFFGRQRKSVLSAMGAKSGVNSDGTPEWWDADRWDRELAQDLHRAFVEGAEASAKRALSALGIDPNLYDVPRTRNYLMKLAEARARGINAVTLRQLLEAVGGEHGDGAQGATPSGVFDKALDSRAAAQAASIATAIAGWGAIEGARQCGPSTVMKTWETNPSKEPRPEHARLAGETVGIDELFSNGADWPGDTARLSVAEVAYCHCEVTLTIPDGYGPEPPKSADVKGWRSPRSLFRHIRKHGAAYGILGTRPEDQEAYNRVMSEVIDGYDAIAYTSDFPGQWSETCVVYFKGSDMVVVNMDRMERVTLLKYERGISHVFDTLWDTARG